MRKVFWFLRQLRRTLLVVVLLGSLFLNVAFLAGGAVYGFAAGLFEMATGTPSLLSRHRTEVARLAGDLDAEKMAYRRMRMELTETAGKLAAQRAAQLRLEAESAKKRAVLQSELTKTSRQVSVQQQTNRRLRSEVGAATRRLAAQKIAQRTLERNRTELLAAARTLNAETKRLQSRSRQLNGQVATLSREVTMTSAQVARIAGGVDRISNLSYRRAARLSSAQGGNILTGWFPYAGTVLAGTLIAWELYDACSTIDYINELKGIIDPEHKPTVCGVDWERDLSVIELHGKKYAEIRRSDVPEEILRFFDTSLDRDDPTYPPVGEEIGEFLWVTDQHGLAFIRELKWGRDRYFVELK